MFDVKRRLAAIEERLRRLEQNQARETAGRSEKAGLEQARLEQARDMAPPAGDQGKKKTTSSIPVAESDSRSGVTTILGWAGATALVAAAAYLIRLAIDSGWLTPIRQIALAELGGLLLIVSGLVLRRSDREYASLLPAGGIVILFLATYAAHVYFGLIDAPVAGATVMLICVLALWLCRVFGNLMFALFSVVGSYSAPFLLDSLTPDITGLVIYFSAWSVLYCVYAIWIGQRIIYLLAAYMALIGFDVIWRASSPEQWAWAFGSGQWTLALGFQTLQLVIFAGGTAAYSMKWRSPMGMDMAWAHAPVVVIFYFIQYSLLNEYSPGSVFWIPMLSGIVMMACFGLARAYLNDPLKGARLLVSAYMALVLFHAGFLDTLPVEWRPWVGVTVAPALVAYAAWRGDWRSVDPPMWYAAGMVYLLSCIQVIANTGLEDVPASTALMLLVPVQLYIAYYWVHRVNETETWGVFLLYLGHVASMAAAVHLLDSRLEVSVAWGALAILCLIVALAWKDRLLGQSSLLVFGASGAKVLIYDLSDAGPLIRIGILVVLGITFYLGGLLYQRLTDIRQPAG